MYLCSAAVEQPLQVVVCCISAVSYDLCAIHRNFTLTCLPWIVVQCVVCASRYCILGTLKSLFLSHFLRQYKYGFVRPQQGVQGDRIWGNLVLVFHVHKFHPHHNLCIVIFSCCAHKPDFHHNLCILILSCCAHKPDFRHNLCNLIFPCCAHKSGFRHNLCIVILSCCAHKSDFRDNICIVILSSCAAKSDFRHNLCESLHLVCCLDFLQLSKHFMQHFVNWFFCF